MTSKADKGVINMNIIESITNIVGAKGILLGGDVSERPNASMGMGSCPAKAIVRPQSTQELSQVMKCCHENEQTIVPMGGLTGLVNGITCSTDDIAISLERMRTIEHIDTEAGTMVVQAGAVLQSVQEAAKEAGWQYAVDFGARGSANIGGTISTNAGGNSVVRYGMTREQVLGLEAVLADGTVISSMNEMLKNNSGYDLKQLFIGSEGTLGIVTRAVLRLKPAPRAVQTAFLAMNSFDDVAKVLKRVGVDFEGKLSSFEVMWNNYYHLMVEKTGRHQAFLPTNFPYYVLLETEGSDPSREEELFTDVLGSLMEDELVADAVIAQSSKQAQELWEMRDDIEAITSTMMPGIAFDISFPIREMESYVSGIIKELGIKHPDANLVSFGHVGDGNIHMCIGPIDDKHAVETLVYQALGDINGAISAEHGIGLEKREFLSHSRSADEIALMRTIKKALDPKNILNPGKIF